MNTRQPHSSFVAECSSYARWNDTSAREKTMIRSGQEMQTSWLCASKTPNLSFVTCKFPIAPCNIPLAALVGTIEQLWVKDCYACFPFVSWNLEMLAGQTFLSSSFTLGSGTKLSGFLIEDIWLPSRLHPSYGFDALTWSASRTWSGTQLLFQCVGKWTTQECHNPSSLVAFLHAPTDSVLMFFMKGKYPFFLIFSLSSNFTLATKSCPITNHSLQN